ncbi:hypothetical protein KJF94_17555 [Pseudomonas hormoni]|uniref:Uncharacterized protein n=1 Tax=Pseudomonas hormoni TaxID=3093767 RepID=A0ABX8ET78_9PSED|nr:hypothetical protein [Pseudomonas hormoni]QVW21708.1 hypothetical protein KJF94_17555 [Pseudomonas hormoni]
MSKLKNFVAVDWRSGKDKIYFFFKDSNTYTRFDIADEKAAEGFPKAINHSSWHDFHEHVKDLRFGFTTTHVEVERSNNTDQDHLWLFYYDRVPMVCKYDQDTDKVIRRTPVAKSIWKCLLPYFDNIIFGTWWRTSSFGRAPIRLLMNNGKSLYVDLGSAQDIEASVRIETINNTTWPGLEPYMHRIITAAQNDRTFASSLLYIFLTNNECLVYNIPDNKVEDRYVVSDDTWPGLLRD